MTPPRTHAHNRSNSQDPSDSENTPQLSIDTSRADLLKFARQYQADKNTAQAEVNRLTRKLGDITNDNDGNDTSGHSRAKRQRVHHDSPSADTDDEDMNSGTRASEQFVLQAGHKFFLLYAPWIRSGDNLFDLDVDEDYDAADRFKDDQNKAQGQLREIIDLLQEKFEVQSLRKRWLRRQFANGLNTQRHNTANRIRHSCASILGACESDLLKPDVRMAKFREEIGWVNETSVYSSVDVPILHKDWRGEYSLSSAFLNPKLMGIYVALIRGPKAGKHFMNGETVHPQTETMARIHNIHNITPGAIATCAVLARWALSGDDTLQDVGSRTGINYFHDFEEYLTILETGLRRRKKSVLNIIKQWDEKIFPNSESSLVKGKKKDEGSGLKKAMDLLEADSEEEDNQIEGQGGNGEGALP